MTPARRAWSIRQRLVYSTAGVLVGLLGLEGLLRLTGFRYSVAPQSMEYVRWIASLGHAQHTREGDFRITFHADPELLWAPEPNPAVTNPLGFRGREWNLIKPAGVRRVVCLGDSCTIAGEVPYPERLETFLNARGPKSRYEVYNAGVGSWSSYQGRRLLEKRVLEYRPDMVTVYFGWNDHWLAWSHPDKALGPYLADRVPWINWTNHSRLAQALTRVSHELVPPADPRERNPPLFRVALEDYKDNLRAMGRLVRERGGRTVYMTAPSALHPGHPVVQFLHSRSRLFHDPARINAVHDLYNDAVREVAGEEGAPLVDLARLLLYRSDAESLFTDGIHLTEEGLAWVARELGGVVLEEAGGGRLASRN